MNKKMNSGFLLDKNGNLVEKGYATSLVRYYNRNEIKASKWRIKEWDYYYVGDDEYGIAMTIDDNGYMGLTSCSILGFKDKLVVNHANMFWFPFGKINMPGSSRTGSVEKKGGNYYARFENEAGKRTLYFKVKNLYGRPFECEVHLEETSNNSIVVATPFNKPKHFYYNQKINNLKVTGGFSWGKLRHNFKENSFGVLDWGRGVWTYKNTWYWSSMSGQSGDDIIGFNLGYGFGDTKAASENMLFVNKEAYKLNDVIFDIPKDKDNKELYLQPWKIYSKDGAIDLEFTPILDRHDKSSALIISQDAHQVFGKFTGKFKVEDKVIEINNMIGFAEKVKNKR